MRRLVLTCALFLGGCADRAPAPTVPPELIRPVEVRCRDGATARALGDCALALRAGLAEANDKLASVAAILALP